MVFGGRYACDEERDLELLFGVGKVHGLIHGDAGIEGVGTVLHECGVSSLGEVEVVVETAEGGVAGTEWYQTFELISEENRPLMEFMPSEVEEKEKKEKEKKDRSPGVIDAPKVGYSWGLVIAGCNNSSDGLIPLDVVSNVDYYVHVVCRADNLKKVYKEWVSVHWSGDEVDKDNLTIAKASSEDKGKCEAEYLLLSKEGE